MGIYNHLVYWDGSNWRAKQIENIYDIEAEEIEDKWEDGPTYHVKWYKTPNGVEFPVYYNYYQETFDVVDTDRMSKEELNAFLEELDRNDEILVAFKRVQRGASL